MGSEEAMSQPAVRMADLLPGDIMFGPIGGLIPGVFPVGIGQLLLAGRTQRMTWRRWWEIRHVGMVVEASQQLPPGSLWKNHPHETGIIIAPELVQAVPRGAERIEMRQWKHWTLRHVYIRPAYRHDDDEALGHQVPTQAFDAVWAAKKYVGTPYNFLTYGKLAASKLGLPISRRVLERWISTRRDMMCSQLVDQALADAGYHVFDDGRLPQDVTPADLYLGLLALPGQWCLPGLTPWLDNATHPMMRTS